MRLPSTIPQPLARAIQRVADAAWDFYEQPYRQAEALLTLDRLLSPRIPLPKMGNWVISPDFALLLVQQAKTRRPGTIVELGSGVSTLVLSYALEQVGNGRIVSLDHEQRFVDQTRTLLDEHGLGGRVTLLHAPLQLVQIDGRGYRWYAQPPELPESIDMLIVDGPPGELQKLSRYPAMPRLISNLDRNALVIVDDARRRDERAMVKRWLRRYPEFQVRFEPLQKGAALLERAQGAP